MEQSKLVDLLKTFGTKELREFNEFVQSPFFNKNIELISFYEHLRSLAPVFQPVRLEREAVFNALYPDKPYDDKQLNYLNNFLLKLAEQYIAYRRFSQNDLLERYQLLESYNQRNLDKHYQFVYGQTIKQLEELPNRNHEFYHLQYALADISNRHFLKQQIRRYDDRLQLAADNLDQYYLAAKLKYSCEMLDRKMSIAAEYEVRFADVVRQLVEANVGLQTPPIAIYHTILNMLLDMDNTTYFNKLVELTEQHKGHFPLDELKDLYSYAINYCIRRVNKGAPEFLKELFELYLKSLDAGTLMDGGYLSPWAYKNLIGVGLRLKKFDWTEDFIREYNAKLAPEFQANALHYNLAELYYYKQDHSKALTHLNKVEFSDIYYNLDTKKMMLKIYFELDEIDALLSLLASFKMFLKRTKLISSGNKVAYLNFVQALTLLARKERRVLPALQKMINSPEPIGDRAWLKLMLQRVPVY
ncbi:hypothetical protein BH09BAC1_BH09BAC1_10930 [soil metagenome]